MFGQLVAYINGVAGENFKSATQKIRDYVEELELDDFQEIVKNIGTIPENIVHDSTEEKLYSKASDIVLARCFRFWEWMQKHWTKGQTVQIFWQKVQKDINIA